jgi:hypothetical protein
MLNKSTQIFKHRQIASKNYGTRRMPSISLNGYDLLDFGFDVDEPVIVSYAWEKITIQLAHKRKNCIIYKEMRQENPDLQYLLDKLGLIFI